MSAVIEQSYLPAGKFILNHDIMNCTAEGVIGNHLYSGRALGLSEPWDIIQLHPDLRPLWTSIRQHYKHIGLSHTENIIWDLNLKELGAHIGYQPSVFYFGPHECQYWGDYKWLETVEYINSKNNFIALAEKLGVDVPKTLCFDGVTDIKTSDIDNIIFPCYLKAAISVSGVGIYRCENQQDFIQALGKFATEIPVQVQEEIITETFLNMQYRITGDSLTRLAASEQILDGFVHQGNRVPASHEPWEAVDPMAQWLKDQGMKGIFAFDVAIVQTNEGLRFPAIECNPRFNGASYPTMIANKLNIHKWSSISLSTRYQSLEKINLEGIEFNQQTGNGVILINWGTVLVGKLMFLIAGSIDYQQELLKELKSRL